MNLDQFRAMLTLGDDTDGRTVLPVPDPGVERIFGGQIMAQLIVAAAPPGSAKAVKSLQIAFPAPDAPLSPCTWTSSKPTTAARWGIGVRWRGRARSPTAGWSRPRRSSSTAPTQPSKGTTTNTAPPQPVIRWPPNPLTSR